MDKNTLSHEQQIMVIMRKVLGSIVRETTPQPGHRHPLSDGTIEDIKQCFALISAREKELAEAAGIENKMRPRYIDEPTAQESQVVSITSIGKMKKEDPEQAD
ncbi:MAG: segregation and condensation protein A [Gammaproteobacteria bacterium]|nr:segregation and condensation protein A [Gammaproteobacteria bacterium]